MVKGLEHFGESFKEHSEHYILIGGAACAINCENANPPVDFRKTEDLDIVLVVEQLTTDFVVTLWNYIKDGQYKVKNKKTEKEGDFVLHRFAAPSTQGFPKQIELFSIQQEGINLDQDQHLTPIESPDDLSNFSAILLDKDYYQLINDHRVNIKGISTLPPHILILLKAKAWLGNRDLYEQGREKKGNVDKHPLDIFTLNDINDEDPRFSVESSIMGDLEQVYKLFKDPKEQENLVATAGFALKFEELVIELTEFYL